MTRDYYTRNILFFNLLCNGTEPITNVLVVLGIMKLISLNYKNCVEGLCIFTTYSNCSTDSIKSQTALIENSGCG